MNLPWWIPLGSTPEVLPQELKTWLEDGRPLQIIDSRTTVEYQQGTIRNAQHAPVTALPGSIDRLNLDPSIPVVVLCLSGHRSLPGTRLLHRRGYQAYSLKGGLIAWKLAGYQVQ